MRLNARCVQVPALPPITDYLAIDTGMHIHNGTITMEDRPATAFNTLTWDDHGCDGEQTPCSAGAVHAQCKQPTEGQGSPTPEPGPQQSLTPCCAADHYLIGVQTATNVTIPDWVLALPPPATQ